MHSRTSRTHEVRSHRLRIGGAKANARKLGALYQAATGQGLKPFLPPTFNQVVDIYSDYRRKTRGLTHGRP